MKKSVPLFILFIALSIFALSGCSGSDGSAGAPGAAGLAGPAGTVNPADVTNAANAAVTLAAIQPESCAICHNGTGVGHQAMYNRYTSADANFSVTIDNVASIVDPADATKFKTSITFTIKLKDANGYLQPLPDVASLVALKQKTVYAVQYFGATGDFKNSKSFSISNSTTVATATPGQFTVTASGVPFMPESPVNVATGATGGDVYMYFASSQIPFESVGRGHYAMYDNRINVGKQYPAAGAVNYVSAANVSACEGCHGKPYAKHGYRMAQTFGNTLPDFVACKNCHFDDRAGTDQGWQLLANDPAAFAAQGGTPTAAQNTQYAYTANLMNDTHMSHAMEFEYPQAMSNCVVCHAGKLTAGPAVLQDANFTLTTCKSCHPVSLPPNAADADTKRAPALSTVIPHALPADGICNSCHKAGGIAPVFSTIHTGYEKIIYAAADTKYSDIFTAKIDSTTISGNILDIKFSATKTDPTSATTLKVTDIVPTVMVGLYGYGTNDFIVDSHGSTTINGVSSRNLEFPVDGTTTNPRFTVVSAANGSWEVKADLTLWADKITAGVVKRAEIAVMPKLVKVVGLKDDATNKETNDYTVAVVAPSKTFDLTTKTLAAANTDSTIVNVTGCNKCHGALGVTFHTADRGGNVVVCRMCHTTRSGGSHLEMQSRSIDSYVHAIHAFQPFDIKNVDFANPVAALRYSLTIESTYPNFTLKNCESCHKPGTYEASDQSLSLAGTLSAASTLKNATRTIGAVPSYVSGPGSRSCGSCHRSAMINEDKAGDLASLNQHTKANGYLAEVPATTNTLLDDIITKIMAIFK